KGLIGMFPVLIVGLGMAVVRGLAWRDLNAVRGAALFAAVAGPWHALVAWRSPALFEFYVLDAHLLRLLNARRYVEADVPISTLAFFVASFIWAFPWSVVGLWALWAGAGLSAAQVLNGLAELNAYYRILRDQKIPLPFEPRPFGVLLQGLGLALLAGWGLAALCWARGWRRSAFASLVGLSVVI